MNVSKIKLRIRRNSKARPMRKLTWLDVRLCLFVFFARHSTNTEEEDDWLAGRLGDSVTDCDSCHRHYYYCH